MQPSREQTERILRSKLIELSELISLLTAYGQAETANQIFLEQRRIADRLALLRKDGQ